MYLRVKRGAASNLKRKEPTDKSPHKHIKPGQVKCPYLIGINIDRDSFYSQEAHPGNPTRCTASA